MLGTPICPGRRWSSRQPWSPRSTARRRRSPRASRTRREVVVEGRHRAQRGRSAGAGRARGARRGRRLGRRVHLRRHRYRRLGHVRPVGAPGGDGDRHVAGHARAPSCSRPPDDGRGRWHGRRSPSTTSRADAWSSRGSRRARRPRLRAVGEDTGTRERAAILDETLTILDGLWSGEPFEHQGTRYDVGRLTFRPRPVQRPRIPIWVVAAWPSRAFDGTCPPMGRRRAPDIGCRGGQGRRRPRASRRSEAGRSGPSRSSSRDRPRPTPPRRQLPRSRARTPVRPGGSTPTGSTPRLRRSRPGSPPGRHGYPDSMPKELIDLAPPVERAFLIAVDTGDDPGWTAEESLAELASLADTAGAEVVGAEWQNRRHIDPNWYVGKGKAEELVSAKAETGLHAAGRGRRAQAEPAEVARELLGVKILDRSGLILDIFAQHARTHEGRLQVELAQLEYQLPRLTRLWTHLSRTQGGIGSRGPGEMPAGDRPAHHPHQASASSRSGSSRSASSARPRPAPVTGGWCRRSPSWATPTPASRSMLNALTGQEAARAEDRAVRDARPHQPLGQAGRRPVGHRDRHRGLHPQAAPPAGGRLPGHARGGRPGGRAAGGRRRRRPVTRRSTGGPCSRCSTSSGAGDKPRLVASSTRRTWSWTGRTRCDGRRPSSTAR